MPDAAFIRRVLLKNYKSIAGCEVNLGALTFLVGPNGSGKSNFLDALRFVTDSLRTSPDHALRERGGINEVRRRSGGHPTHFGMRFEYVLPDARRGHFAFKIGAKSQGGFEVQSEDCLVYGPDALRHAFYRVSNGKVQANVSPTPVPAGDRLFLVHASGIPEFRPVYDGLARMGFYNPSPVVIRELQSPDAGDLLTRDGRNIASVLRRLATNRPEGKRRVEEYLAKVVPGVQGVDAKAIGPKETVEFRQHVRGSEHPWRFLASNMSDGTLRALSVLVALFQSDGRSDARVPLVGVEEPETALHPAAAGVLTDALRDSSSETQVLVTSHSPDLLDDPSLETDSILAVDSVDGITRIGRLDDAGRGALRDRLYTAGELLRMNQLVPAPDAPCDVSESQLLLFDGEKT
jgi:predicted ATPase